MSSTGRSRKCNVELTCNNMNEPPSCTAKFNMGNGCRNFVSHAAHVQLGYASTRFNCTICQSSMMCQQCTVLTPITSNSSCPKVTSTPSYNCNTTDVPSFNITPMIRSNCTCMYTTNAITTTSTSDSTFSRPTQSTANNTCSHVAENTCTITRQPTTTTTTIIITTTSTIRRPGYEATTTTCSCDKDTTSTIYSIQTPSIDPATTSIFSQILTTSSISTTSIHTCGPVVDTLPATTLHGVYMTVLLVLVAVTITMTTLVVYMCLMMRRAKSARVPQTTTGTTHTNNMAASDYCEPISLKYMQTTGTEKGR